MRVPLVTGCLCSSRQTAYEHQTESPLYQHHHQQPDTVSLDSHSKIANDLSQQIIINSSQVSFYFIGGFKGSCFSNMTKLPFSSALLNCNLEMHYEMRIVVSMSICQTAKNSTCS